MKKFKMKHTVFDAHEESFNEGSAPSWLTSENTIPGSTMDARWFWQDYVLQLKVGQSVSTDFWLIARVE